VCSLPSIDGNIEETLSQSADSAQPRVRAAGVRVLSVRAAGVIVAASVLAFGLAGGAVSGSASGLHGIVMRGPTMPVCRVNDPCEQPARGLLIRFIRDGVVKAEVKTTQTGGYSVKLRPGRYSVKTAQRRPGAGLTPRFVHVPRGRIARVDFHLDTGLQ
jgi:hypothetical protein